METKLNKKQQAFADEYMINGFNQRLAYQAAYQNVSDEAADANASRLLTNVKVKEYIAQVQAINRAKYNVTKEEIIEVVKKVMNATDYNPVHSSNLKAAEILTKMFGYTVEKVEYKISHEQPLFGEVKKDDQ